MAPSKPPPDSVVSGPVGASAGSEPEAYWELHAELHPDAEELWGLFCYERGALGAEVLLDTGPVRIVRHFFAAAPDAVAWQAAFEQDYPAVPRPLRLTVRRQAREAWESAWRVHFQPLRLGRRLLVTPPWETPDAGSVGNAQDARRVRIVINPGQGFGTGWHPSTALALEALEASLAEGPAPARMLDVGTGSGILAIAGRLLGAAHAVALDVDTVALPEVRRNAALSGVQPPPWVVRGRPDCLRGRFPLVVANIVSEVLLRHCAELVGLTEQDGCLILSGILVSERERLLEAYAARGLRLQREHRREGWLALRLQRT